MPRVFETEEEYNADPRSCGDVRQDFKECVLTSDCVKKDKRHPKECVRLNLIHEECAELRYLLFQCKRSLLDNRARFRGRKGY